MWAVSDHVNLNNKFKSSEDREAPGHSGVSAGFGGGTAWRKRGQISSFSSANAARYGGRAI